LPPHLGDDPAGFQRRESQRRAQGDEEKEAGMVQPARAPESQPQIGRGHGGHQGARADHDLESGMHRQHRRPLVAGEIFQSLHLGPEIAVGQETQHAGQGERVTHPLFGFVGKPPDEQRSAGFGAEQGFHGGQLGRLAARGALGQPVPAQGLEQGRHRPDE
jgi:hypothetical protein